MKLGACMPETSDVVSFARLFTDSHQGEANYLTIEPSVLSWETWKAACDRMLNYGITPESGTNRKGSKKGKTKVKTYTRADALIAVSQCLTEKLDNEHRLTNAIYWASLNVPLWALAVLGYTDRWQLRLDMPKLLPTTMHVLSVRSTHNDLGHVARCLASVGGRNKDLVNEAFLGEWFLEACCVIYGKHDRDTITEMLEACYPAEFAYITGPIVYIEDGETTL